MILAIDTAQTPASVALADTAGRVVAMHVFPPTAQTAAQLLPVIRDMLVEAGCAASALTRVAVCQGPGSFTGIRIGLAAACGLQVALRVPVVALSTLAAYAVLAASSAREGQPVVARVGDGAGGIVEQVFAADGQALGEIVRVDGAADGEGAVRLAAAAEGMRHGALVEAAEGPLSLEAVRDFARSETRVEITNSLLSQKGQGLPGQHPTLGACLCTGPGWGLPPQPLAAALAQAAAWGLGENSPAALVPLYLRPSYAEAALSPAAH